LTLSTFLFQEPHQVRPAQDIKVHRDLVKQQHLEGLEQAHGDLHAAALTVRHLMHAPCGVNVEDVNEALAAGGVYARDTAEHLHGGNVALWERGGKDEKLG
jgi:hypothetical protein